MNFLYPLFLAGIVAIGLPIVLHMIRHHTRKRVTFSSLMFLRTTLPRFRNRSRIENLLLLILRCVILCLLAFAFSRPFFTRETVAEQVSLGRRVVVLIDTSASMRREGMWQQAISQARSVLDDIGPDDRACVMSFDRGTQTLIGFEQWNQLDPSQRVFIVIDSISKLSPGWNMTNLGHALVGAAEAIEDDEINDRRQAAGIRQVVLISDLQAGSSVEALQAYEWPQNIELIIKPIQARGTTNASMQLVTARDYLSRSESDNVPNIRITNSGDADLEHFKLDWIGDDPEKKSQESMEVYVPAGHNVVVRFPSSIDASSGGKVVLSGDNHDFDNILYLAPHLAQQVNIVYIGDDNADDFKGMLYYLQRAFGAAGAIDTKIVSIPSGDEVTETNIDKAHLIITTDSIKQENIGSLRRYLESGGIVLSVLKSPGAAVTMAALAGVENIVAKEAEIDKYAMLGRIDFEHPLLASFSDPRFGDFTQIHFWKYRRIDITDLPNVRILAWFDNPDKSGTGEGHREDPALFEVPVGKGSLLVLTSSWRPSDSQLALSSKFVPLLYSVLEYGGNVTERQSQYFVGDSVPVPSSAGTTAVYSKIRSPDGSTVNLDTNRQTFTQTDVPGIYAFASSSDSRFFSINLPARESRTDKMSIEELENFGVSPGQSANVTTEKIAQTRSHSSFAEMEYNQKVWRWVFVLLLVVSLVETWLAGWLTRPPSESSGGFK